MSDEYTKLQWDAIRRAMTTEAPYYGKERLNHDRPLTGQFRDYLTEIDVTDPRETLPEDYQRHLDNEA